MVRSRSGRAHNLISVLRCDQFLFQSSVLGLQIIDPRPQHRHPDFRRLNIISQVAYLPFKSDLFCVQAGVLLLQSVVDSLKLQGPFLQLVKLIFQSALFCGQAGALLLQSVLNSLELLGLFPQLVDLISKSNGGL